VVELYSHLLAFVVLAVAAVYDLRTTEVPDWLSATGVVGGLTIHAAAALLYNSWEPLIWSVGVGAVFSVYGWGMYFAGMWGGADAFATSILGFAAPYAVSGPSLTYPADLFINLMLVGFVYSIGFAAVKAARIPEVREGFRDRLTQETPRVALEISGALVAGFLLSSYTPLNGWIYGVGLGTMSLLYRFLKAVEEHAMVREVSLEEVEEGEVVAEVDHRVRGASQEELEDLDKEKVSVKSGVKFIPAFPAALLLTDVFGLGLGLVALLVS
jgi:Flp pilus assembly protein protease CpaA